ncbi:MAG: ATP phosphoribosyltransferase [Anaerolineales bacterium]|nr:ATP phosphoribosyltransferase [Anaerolineales bacterium]
MTTRTDIRLALPSKGRLEQAALQFLSAAGLRVDKPNPRQYFARIPDLPGLRVLFQRPGDIVVSVREGGVDFGLAGLDVIEERRGQADEVLVVHEALGFGHCALALAVPEDWPVRAVADLARPAAGLPAPLRVATKYPHLTQRFLRGHGVEHFTLIDAEGTLEVAPAIGYADLIVDLVSSGQTLQDNRLRALPDGEVLRSQAALIANRAALQGRPEVLAMARQLLEYVEAYLRGQENCLVVANMRGADPDDIARRLLGHPDLGGLQGPTIAPIYTRGGERWHSVSIVVHKDRLIQSVRALRSVGGSGVIVAPLTYIFEEEPERARRLNENL